MTDLTDEFPAGLEPEDDFDSDFADLHVNFTDQEAASKALEALPSGRYNVRIAKVEVRRSTSEKNYNKPYYNIEFRVIDGQYTNRPISGNVMLFEGALYSLNQLMNSTGFTTKGGQIRVPRREELLGKELTVRGIKKPANDKYDERFEVKGYMPLQASRQMASANSLEP